MSNLRYTHVFIVKIAQRRAFAADALAHSRSSWGRLCAPRWWPPVRRILRVQNEKPMDFAAQRWFNWMV